MKLHEVLDVAAAYAKLLKDDHGFPEQHLVSMYPQMVDMADEFKLNRSLGFMQGVLWVQKHFTLEQLKAHNRNGRVVT